MSVKKENWTFSPRMTIDHLKTLPKSEQSSLLSLYDRMSRGGDGGQLEPWGFHTVRSALYPCWSNDDFKVVVESFSPMKPPKELD